MSRYGGHSAPRNAHSTSYNRDFQSRRNGKRAERKRRNRAKFRCNRYNSPLDAYSIRNRSDTCYACSKHYHSQPHWLSSSTQFGNTGNCIHHHKHGNSRVSSVPRTPLATTNNSANIATDGASTDAQAIRNHNDIEKGDEIMSFLEHGMKNCSVPSSFTDLTSNEFKPRNPKVVTSPCALLAKFSFFPSATHIDRFV